MMLPQRVKLSRKATEKLRYMKSTTGLTPNILGRIAIMLAIREGGDLSNAGVSDSEGQELSKDVLFGEHADVYQVMINQYVHDKSIDMTAQQVISAMIEVGVFKMGHLKSLDDVCSL